MTQSSLEALLAVLGQEPDDIDDVSIPQLRTETRLKLAKKHLELKKENVNENVLALLAATASKPSKTRDAIIFASLTELLRDTSGLSEAETDAISTSLAHLLSVSPSPGVSHLLTACAQRVPPHAGVAAACASLLLQNDESGESLLTEICAKHDESVQRVLKLLRVVESPNTTRVLSTLLSALPLTRRLAVVDEMMDTLESLRSLHIAIALAKYLCADESNAQVYAPRRLELMRVCISFATQGSPQRRVQAVRAIHESSLCGPMHRRRIPPTGALILGILNDTSKKHKSEREACVALLHEFVRHCGTAPGFVEIGAFLLHCIDRLPSRKGLAPVIKSIKRSMDKVRKARKGAKSLKSVADDLARAEPRLWTA